MDGDGKSLNRWELSFDGMTSDNVAVKELSISGSTGYGMNGVMTVGKGKIYPWLPSDATKILEKAMVEQDDTALPYSGIISLGAATHSGKLSPAYYEICNGYGNPEGYAEMQKGSTKLNILQPPKSLDKWYRIYEFVGRDSSDREVTLTNLDDTPDMTLLPNVPGYTDSAGRWIAGRGKKIYFHAYNIPYTIHYDPAKPHSASTEISGETADQEYRHMDVQTTFPACGYTLPGYEFCGWTRNKDSGVVDFEPWKQLYRDYNIESLTDVPGDDVTLYAVWKPKTYTVTLKSTDPDMEKTTTIDDIEFDVGVSITPISELVSESEWTIPEHKSFGGWRVPGRFGSFYADGAVGVNFVEKEGGAPRLDENGNPIGLTLEAVWMDNTFGSINIYATDNHEPVDILGENGTFRVKKDGDGESESFTLSVNRVSENAGRYETTDLSAFDGKLDPGGEPVLFHLSMDNVDDYTIPQKWQSFYLKNGDNLVIPLDYYTVSIDDPDRAVSDNYIALEGGMEQPTDRLHVPAGTRVKVHATVGQNPGYYFLGYSVRGVDPAGFDHDLEGSQTVTISGNVAFRTFGMPNEYKVRFDANTTAAVRGEMEDQKFTCHRPAKALRKNLFERDGAVFAGWNTEPDGSGTSYADEEAVADLTMDRDAVVPLYAQWDLTPYSIEYDLDGGALPAGKTNPTTYNVETESFTLFNPTKDEHKFCGWMGSEKRAPEQTLTVSSGSVGDRKYRALWADQDYTVSFNSCGGSDVDPQIIAIHGHAVKPDPDPVMEDHRFAGWYADAGYSTGFDFDNTEITQDSTLYARWEPVTHTVSFSLNGKTGAVPESQIIANRGEVNKPADPTAEGFYFMGWYKDAEGYERFDFATPVLSEMTLYAKWVEDTATLYTVSFNLAGHGDPIASQKVEEGGFAGEPAAPEADGYVFKGWFRDAEHKVRYDFSDPVTEDITLWALWDETPEAEPFKVYFTPEEFAPDPYRGLTKDPETGRYEIIYTGAAIKPAVTVTDLHGKALTQGKDYTLKYQRNKNASASPAIVTVTGKGNYAGRKKLYFYIGKVDLGKAKVKRLLTVPEMIAVKKGKKASLVLTYRGAVIGRSNYKLSNTGKISEDTTLDILGKGANFTGIIKDVPVKAMTAAELRAQTIRVTLVSPKHTFDGSEQYLTDEELVVTAGYPAQPLVKDRDYVLIYTNNTNAGKAKVTVKARPPYAGMVTKTFTIAPDKKSAVNVRVNDSKSVYFDPAGAKPEIYASVSGNGYKLTAGRDYKVKYTANKTRGMGAFTLTFIGNFKGHRAVKGNFEIQPASFASASANAPDLIYKKAGKYRSAPTVTINGAVVSSKNYKVRYFDGTRELGAAEKITLAAGESEKVITVKVTGCNNYRYAVKTFTYRISRAAGKTDLTKAKIVGKDTTKAVKPQAYTGDYVTPEFDVLVKVGGKWTKVDPSNYTVVYHGNLNKGKGTILIKSDGINTVGSKSAKFTIGAKLLGLFG